MKITKPYFYLIMLASLSIGTNIALLMALNSEKEKTEGISESMMRIKASLLDFQAILDAKGFKTETLDLGEGVSLEMVHIPAGTFTMGSPDDEEGRRENEGPQHEVTISHDFYMGKYEITKAQWKAVMGTTPWTRDDLFKNEPNSPAIFISWDDINGPEGFLKVLNDHLTSTGQQLAACRLPTEAEWEYACRAGTTTRFYWGDDPNKTELNHYAWWGNPPLRTMNRIVDDSYVVGQKKPNAFGLYDMSGNVRELCQGWYGPYDSKPKTDPTGATSGTLRISRSGVSSASRWKITQKNFGYFYDGFRVVMTKP